METTKVQQMLKRYTSMTTSTRPTSSPKEWEDAKCPICMEHPHNAVLLICSSNGKGCHPFMCDNGPTLSNCYEKFCKSAATPLSCPCCRGLIKKHIVVKAARVFLNARRRICMHEACYFSGTYKELVDHTRIVHTDAIPSKVPESDSQCSCSCMGFSIGCCFGFCNFCCTRHSCCCCCC